MLRCSLLLYSFYAILQQLCNFELWDEGASVTLPHAVQEGYVLCRIRTFLFDYSFVLLFGLAHDQS
jgi:hypothetical protein